MREENGSTFIWVHIRIHIPSRLQESMSARALTDFKRFIMNHHRELNEV